MPNGGINMCGIAGWIDYKDDPEQSFKPWAASGVTEKFRPFQQAEKGVVHGVLAVRGIGEIARRPLQHPVMPGCVDFADVRFGMRCF